MSLGRIIGLAVGVLAAIAIVVGFRTIGSPEHQRRLAADRARVEDMRAIVSRIRERDENAPRTLPAQVRRKYFSGFDASGEYVRTAGYEYRRIDASRFELCASFFEPAGGEQADAGYAHSAGKTCYRYDMRESSTTPLP